MMADMTEMQIERLRKLAEPHPNKSKHQCEMDELVLMALDRIGTLQDLSSDKSNTISAMIDDRARLHARVAELEAEKNDSDRALADAVGLDDAKFGCRFALFVLRGVARNLGLGASGWTYIELDRRLQLAKPGWSNSAEPDQGGKHA